MNAFTAKPDDTAGKMIAAGNRLAAMLDTSLTAPVEQWPDEAEIDAALKEWRFAVDPCPLAAAGKGIDAPQPQPKPLFGDLIAQHPGLSEELAEMQAPKQEPVAWQQELANILCRVHRDGGHYIAEHGWRKAIDDADLKVADLNAASDAPQPQREQEPVAEYLSKAYHLANELRNHLSIAPAPHPQPKQEPVAWLITFEKQNGERETCAVMGRYEDVKDSCDFGEPEPLYTTPQPQPKREHDLKDVRCECCGYMTYHREHMGCIRAATPQPQPDDTPLLRQALEWIEAQPEPRMIGAFKIITALRERLK